MKRGCSRAGAVLRAALAAALLALPATGSWRADAPRPVRACDRARVLAVLAARHGIRVTGAFDGQDLAHVQVAAALFRDSETRGLTLDFAPARRTCGTLGEWHETGVATIASRRLDTVIHECAHHVLEFSGNARTRVVDALLAQAVRARDGALDGSCVTRPYALASRGGKDHGELHAELVTGLALRRLGWPEAGTVENPRFAPPARVRELVTSLFEDR